MKLIRRNYSKEQDYWRIRTFLREVLILNNLREFSWQTAQLDYWRWHVLLNCREVDSLDELIFIWETSDGKIASVLISDGPGDVSLQLHPEYRSKSLESEMITVAEKHFSVERNGYQQLTVWVHSTDDTRRSIIKERGYIQGKWTENQWRRDLDGTVPGVSLPDGYTIRSLGGVDEIPDRSWASWRGFHPDEPDEDYQGWEWYLNIQRCPLYRRDLDLVAISPTGEIASFCTMWYDDFTRCAYIEPVATVPEYLRLGLARATITEGLQRLRRMGAVRVFVSGYEPGANALYSTTLSPVHDKKEQWIRKWQQ